MKTDFKAVQRYGYTVLYNVSSLHKWIFFESSKLVVVEQEGQKYNATLERRYVT